MLIIFIINTNPPQIQSGATPYKPLDVSKEEKFNSHQYLIQKPTSTIEIKKNFIIGFFTSEEDIDFFVFTDEQLALYTEEFSNNYGFGKIENFLYKVENQDRASFIIPSNLLVDQKNINFVTYFHDEGEGLVIDVELFFYDIIYEDSIFFNGIFQLIIFIAIIGLVFITNKAMKNRIESNKTDIFLVAGRNVKILNSMKKFLESLEITINTFDEIHSTMDPNSFIFDIVDEGISKSKTIIILFTPDEKSKLKEEFIRETDNIEEKEFMGQSRPNVFFEAGMALALKREKTVLVRIGKVKGLSDIQGKYLINLTDDEQDRLKFIKELEKTGLKIDYESKRRWKREGKFTL